ncbi:DUF2243 domain-containing protein [Glycocaulis sp.]|uniref:DUF2243 domain-containing protein n=1 Tax=Glycocaulis sp. TaxID=1969725 RepID=UPI003D1B2050
MKEAGETSALRPLHWPAGVLGFALGGFFDGIVLHQILQWHHLLSGLDTGRGGLRFQILADGVFHALMYAVALAGLVWLWRTRSALHRPGAGRRLLAAMLAGFGVWHVVDTLLSHWILGIHRIRMDAPDPLFWDVIWLALFGLLPMVASVLLWRRGTPSRTGPLTAMLLAGGTVLAGIGSSLPPRGQNGVSVVFAPGTSQADIFTAAALLDARVVGADPTGTVWTFHLPGERSPFTLYRHGAIFVGGAGPAACLSWAELPPADNIT